LFFEQCLNKNKRSESTFVDAQTSSMDHGLCCPFVNMFRRRWISGDNMENDYFQWWIAGQDGLYHPLRTKACVATLGLGQWLSDQVLFGFG
jgi:hypothetical protein